MATVEFRVTAPDNARYWLAVDDKDVRLVNGVGRISLSAGEHILYWHMTGEPGDAISIVGKVGNREVVNVKSSAIPASRKGGGFRRFQV